MRNHWWVWLVLWLTFWLRVRGLFANTFHADEALFATWARHIASWLDPLLLTQAVDKPPLLFYLQALYYPLLGPVEWAARLPNFIASILMVPLTAVLAHNLYHHKTASFVAALIVACSPIAIQFSVTAFTDPLLAFWLVASLTVISNRLSVIGNRSLITDYRLPFASGLLFGLAVATKYQAWLFLPLVVGLGVIGGNGFSRYGRRQWLYWLAGLLPVLTAVFLWEFARTGTFSLWSAQISNFGGVRLVWSWELWPRLIAWGSLWGTAVPIILLPVLLLIMVGLVWQAEGREGQIDGLLVFFVMGYWLFHWLTAVPIWDRYLLPLVPIIAILLGRGFMRLEMGRLVAYQPPSCTVSKKFLPQRHGDTEITKNTLRLRVSVVKEFFGSGLRRLSISISPYLNLPIPNPSTKFRTSLQSLISILILLILLIPAWGARYGRYNVGGQLGADQGAAEIAIYLQDAPYGTVLYDHWYSWQWRYHFFYKGVYVSWFPHGQALAEDLAVFGNDGNGRYVALPNPTRNRFANSQPIIRAIEQAGFTLHPVAHADNITLYQILSK